MEACVSDKKNLGVTRCVKLPSMLKTAFITPKNAVIPALTLADPDLLEAYIQARLVDDYENRWYKLPDFINVEDASEEAVYRSTPLSVQKVRDGRYQWKPEVQVSLCIHKALQSHEGKGERILVVDLENQMTGTEATDDTDATGMTGFLLDLFAVEKVKFNNGTDPSRTPLYISLADNNEFDKHGVMVDVDFVNTLTVLTDVELTLLTDAAGLITFTAKNVCDGENILGLVKEDLVFHKASDNTTVVISTLTYSDGVYSAIQAGSLFVDGTLNFLDPNDMTTQGYESTGAMTVDV